MKITRRTFFTGLAATVTFFGARGCPPQADELTPGNCSLNMGARIPFDDLTAKRVRDTRSALIKGMHWQLSPYMKRVFVWRKKLHLEEERDVFRGELVIYASARLYVLKPGENPQTLRAGWG